MKRQIARVIEILIATRFQTLIPKVRSSKFKNKVYSVIVLKGFPGIWHHQDLMNWFNKNKIEGHIVDFGLQIRTINTYTKKLEDLINKRFQNKKIILLAFSMGGLVAIKYAQQNKWKNIEKIITFASPFKGAPKAKDYRLLPGAKDMAPNSKLLKRVFLEVPKNKVICVSAKTDELIDNSGSFLPGSKHITLTVEGHGSAQVVKNIQPILEKELSSYKSN